MSEWLAFMALSTEIHYNRICAGTGWLLDNTSISASGSF